MIQTLTAMLGGIGPGLAPTDVATMEQEIAASLWQERLLAALSSTFAGLSGALAGIGLFGMLAYAVARRTREIGIRVAIGATARRIATLVLRDAAWTVAPGLLLGLAAYAACSPAIAPLLYGITRWDALSIAGAAACVIGIAAIASFIPAIRAARIEPWEALREE